MHLLGAALEPARDRAVARRPAVLDAASRSASRPCWRRRSRSPPGLATTVLVATAQAGEYTERELDRAVDAAQQRVRRVLGPLHGRRVRADRAPAHAPLRDEARGARRGGGDAFGRTARGTPRPSTTGRQDRHARGRARLAAGRRAVPPARLRDHLRGRRGPRAHLGRARARPRRHADLPARRRASTGRACPT